MLSVIIPSYNEEKMIARTARALSDVLTEAQIPYELLFIDDGSADGTWVEIENASREDPRITGIRFSRNFGKEAAMFAGLERAGGDCCVVIDCDLQHPPEKIVEMFRLWQQGYEVVEGIKEEQTEENGLHRFAAKRFYGMMSRAVGLDMAKSSDFKLLDRKVVDALNQLPERGVFFRALSFWVGYNRAAVSFRVQERTEGKSKWTLRALIRYAIRNVGSFTSAPLHIVTAMGVIMLLSAIVFGTIALVQKFSGVALGGFTTVILLLLLIGSLIMISLGVIGYYIGRIYEEMKGRPRYLVSKTCGKNTEN